MAYTRRGNLQQHLFRARPRDRDVLENELVESIVVDGGAHGGHCGLGDLFGE